MNLLHGEPPRCAAARAPRRVPEEARADAHYRALVDSSLDAIVGMDDKGCITEFNPAAERMFGYRRADALGREVAALMVPPSSRDAHRRGVARHRNAAAPAEFKGRLELMAMRSDGSQFPMEATVCRLPGRGPSQFIASIRDLTERRRLEDEAARLTARLAEAAQQWRLLFDEHPQLVAVYDKATWRFLAVNRAGMSRYGYSEQEFLKLTIFDLAPEADRASWERDLLAAPPAGPRHFRARHRSHTGELIHVEVFSIDTEFEGRPARLVAGIDITKEREATAALRESEARFRALAELSSDWYWEQDEDARITSVTAGSRWPAQFPPPAALIGKRRWELEGTFTDDWEAHKAVIAAHRPFRDLELRRRGNDGNMRYLQISGEPVFDAGERFRGYRGVARDVTDRRRHERLLELQRRVADILDSADETGAAVRELLDALVTSDDWTWGGCWLADAAARRIGLAQAGWAATLDEAPAAQLVPDQGLLGRVWDRGEAVWVRDAERDRDLGDAQLLPGVRCVCALPLGAPGRALGALVLAGRYAREPEPHVLDTLRAIASQLDQFVRRKERERDVVELTAALEQRVRERTAQLESANAELRAFAYSLAHDLRGPLTSIDGFCHVLESQAPERGDPVSSRAVQRVRAGVCQMSEITEAMLTLAHLSDAPQACEAVDLAALARRAFDQLREREPARDASLQSPPSLPARGDPALLAQVMGNLVGNAWKFSGRQSAVRIRVGGETGAHGEAVFFIADEGAGFDMAYAGRLFGAFHRLHTSAEFEGTGIGLALVHKIVQRHGGRIWADARCGAGATFRFTLGGGAVQ